MAIIAVAVLSALGVSLSLVVNTETRIAGNFAASREVMYAADGALEIAAQELLAVGDWDHVFAAGALSTFIDGDPGGQRPLGDGRFVSLPGATDLANNEPRPWGANNPRWRLFAFGRLSPAAYVVVWTADDPAENDGDPARDGTSEANPGTGILALRAEAFGRDGAHSVVEATLRRSVDASGGPVIEMLSWQGIR
jgi:hypothetical protein